MSVLRAHDLNFQVINKNIMKRKQLFSKIIQGLSVTDCYTTVSTDMTSQVSILAL